jgi:hypothetical protein
MTLGGCIAHRHSHSGDRCHHLPVPTFVGESGISPSTNRSLTGWDLQYCLVSAESLLLDGDFHYPRRLTVGSGGEPILVVVTDVFCGEFIQAQLSAAQLVPLFRVEARHDESVANVLSCSLPI